MATVYLFHFKMRRKRGGCDVCGGNLPVGFPGLLTRGKMISMHWKLTFATASLVSSTLLLWMHWRKDGKVREAIQRGDGSVEFTRDPFAYFAMPLVLLLPAWAAFND